MTINVVDAICGTGKSTALINMINEDKSDTRYLYVTPFLTEVERVKISCYEKHFEEPLMVNGKNKLMDIEDLLQRGRNIVSTHALFKKFTPAIIDLIKKKKYILVMDEVIDVIKMMEISKDDLKTISEKYTELQNDGSLKWIADKYEGKFEIYKEIIQNNIALASIDKRGKFHSIIQTLPIELFEAFKDIYVLTYMFKYQVQKYYFDKHKVEYKYWYVKDFHLTEEPQIYNEREIKELIRIYNKEKLNLIGFNRTALSLNWFLRNRNSKEIKQLSNNIYNFFRNVANVSSKRTLWTTFKEAKNSLRRKGFSSGFVPMNMRATNKYADRVAIAYIANRYLQPMIKNYFQDNGIEVDDDGYALSELIQFIFRSAIRNKREILIYVPSRRMRSLLQAWIDKK